MREDGSLFLNVGAKPTDPWIPLEVAQVARRHFKLQNTIHWVKSIAIDREAAGAGGRAWSGTSRSATTSRSTATGSSTTATSSSFTFRRAAGRGSIGARSACPIRIRRTSSDGPRPATGLRCRGNTWFIPYETIQSRDRDRPHPASFPPKVPEQCVRLHGLGRAGVVHGSVPWAGLNGARRGAARPRLRRDRDGRALPARGGRAGQARLRDTRLATKQTQTATRGHGRSAGPRRGLWKRAPVVQLRSCACFVARALRLYPSIYQRNLTPICMSRGPKSVLLAAVGAEARVARQVARSPGWPPRRSSTASRGRRSS